MNFLPSDLDSPTTMGAEHAESSSAAGTALRPSFSKSHEWRVSSADEVIVRTLETSLVTRHSSLQQDFPPSGLDHPATMGAEHAVSSAAAGTALRPSFSTSDGWRVSSDEEVIVRTLEMSLVTCHSSLPQDFPPSDLDSPTTMGAEHAESSSAAGTALRPSFFNPSPPPPLPPPRSIDCPFEAEAEPEAEKEKGRNRFLPFDARNGA